MNVTGAYSAAAARRMRGEFEAHRIAARFGVRAEPYPALPGRIEVTAPGLVLIGTPQDLAAGCRPALMAQWLPFLGSLSRERGVTLHARRG